MGCVSVAGESMSGDTQDERQDVSHRMTFLERKFWWFLFSSKSGLPADGFLIFA